MISTSFRLTFPLLFVLALSYTQLVSTTGANGLSQAAFITGEQKHFEEEGDFFDVVGRFDQAAEPTFVVPSEGSISGLTLHEGNLLVGDFGLNEIKVLSTTGDDLGVFASGTHPVYLESDSQGNVYSGVGFTSSQATAAATRYDSVGNVTGEFSAAELEHPAGVDADRDGNVYVIGESSATLFKFASDTALINQTAFPSLGSVVFQDIAIDEAGQRLFAAGSFGEVGGLYVFDVSGDSPSFVQMIAGPSFPNGYTGFGLFVGVYFEPQSRHVFVTDGIDMRAHEFDANLNLVGTLNTMGNGDVQRDIVTLGVPEPSTVVLLLTAPAVLIPRHRRHA